MTKLQRVVLGSLAASLALCASAAYAGGWAVTTLDPVASEFTAGETYRIGYTIRQHGETPLAGARTAIEIQSPNGPGQRFAAVPDGPTGHYVAEVTFPQAGEWQWRVDQSPFPPQPLGAVRVISGPSASTSSPLLPGLMLATGLATLVFAWRLVVYLRSGRRLASAGVAANLS
jgi:hypothetical protein